MAKVTIKIPHIVWRDGRPRFTPGPGVRKLGFKGEDLKHPAGNWLDLNETIAWSEEKCQEIETRRQQSQCPAPQTKKKSKNHTVKGYVGFGELLVKWHNDLKKEARQTGKPTARTLNWYYRNVETLRKFDEELWTIPAASITHVMANGIYKKLREQKGIAFSKALISTIRPAYHWAMVEMGLVPANPFKDLRISTPPPRLRVGSLEEMKHLIAIADKEQRPDIGDAIMLGLCTGQRQNDRLLFKLKKKNGNTLSFKQSKTGALVEVPAIPPLLQRIEAAEKRRNRQQSKIPTLLINEKDTRSWPEDGDSYRRAFRKVCNTAAQTMPSLKGFRDQDLRDTAVTWLANAGCTLPEIAAITGHSIDNIHSIMKHYLAQTPEQANMAMQKLLSYLDRQGGLN